MITWVNWPNEWQRSISSSRICTETSDSKKSTTMAEAYNPYSIDDSYEDDEEEEVALLNGIGVRR